MSIDLSAIQTMDVAGEHDLSVQFIDKLLGSGWETMTSSTSFSGAAPSLLYPMFELMNTVAFWFVTVLFIWIFAQGLIGTAHEGKVLGTKFHSFWVPARFLTAATAVSPLPCGASIGQLILMAMIGWSISFANTGVSLIADHLVESGGMSVVVANESLREEGFELASGLLKTKVLQIYMEEKQGISVNTNSLLSSFTADTAKSVPGYGSIFSDYNSTALIGSGNKHKADATSGNMQLTFVTPENVKEVGTNALGGVLLTCPNIKDSQVLSSCNAKKAAIETIWNSIEPLAHDIVDGTEQYDHVQSMYNIGQIYATSVASNISGMVKALDSEYYTQLTNFSAQLKTMGWASLGGYYNTISSFQQYTQEMQFQTASYIEPTKNLYEILNYDADGLLAKVRNHEKTTQEDARAAAATGGNPENLVTKLFRKHVMAKATDYFVTGGDPIQNLSNLGRHLINGVVTASAAIGATYVAIKTETAALDNSLWLKVIPGSGAATGAVSGVQKGAINVALFIFAVIALPLLVCGCLLAFYIPSIPWIYFTIGTVGWLILVVVCLMAAPLWVASFALPEGEGISGDHGKRGWSLLLSILLRPPLMVAGFGAAIVIMQVAGDIIFRTGIINQTAITSGHLTGVISFCCMLLILCGVAIAVAVRVFRLVFELAEDVTRWIVQELHSLGVGNDAQGVQSTFNAVGNKIEGLTSAMSRSGAIGAIMSSSDGDKKDDGPGSNTDFDQVDKDTKSENTV